MHRCNLALSGAVFGGGLAPAAASMLSVARPGQARRHPVTPPKYRPYTRASLRIVTFFVKPHLNAEPASSCTASPATHPPRPITPYYRRAPISNTIGDYSEPFVFGFIPSQSISALDRPFIRASSHSFVDPRFPPPNSFLYPVIASLHHVEYRFSRPRH